LLTIRAALGRTGASGAEKRGRGPFQGQNLRPIVRHDIRVSGVTAHEILMIGFGSVERTAFEASDDLAIERAGLAQLRDVSGRDRFLLGVLRKNGGAVARSDVRPLAVELRRVMGDREEQAQQRPIADLARVEHDSDGLGMAGALAADRAVIRAFGIASSVTRLDSANALHVLEHGFDAPEAAAG